MLPVEVLSRFTAPIYIYKTQQLCPPTYKPLYNSPRLHWGEKNNKSSVLLSISPKALQKFRKSSQTTWTYFKVYITVYIFCSAEKVGQIFCDGTWEDGTLQAETISCHLRSDVASQFPKWTLDGIAPFHA